MSFFRFILGLPPKNKSAVFKEAEVVKPEYTSYKVFLYTPLGLEEYLANEEPYCDNGGSLNFTTNDGKEHWYSGTWKYQQL